MTETARITVSPESALIDVPREVDLEVANRKLAFLGVRIDELTPEQEDYQNKSTV